MSDGAVERARWHRLEGWVVVLVILHSVAVGVMLTLFPGWSTRFGGWEGVDPLFFPRQAGVFHFVVSFAYAWEYLRLRGVTILVVTKVVACAFLMAATLFGEAAWSVPFSGVADGLMGLVVLGIHQLGAPPEGFAPAGGADSDHPAGA